jgi:hypothetical protein
MDQSAPRRKHITCPLRVQKVNVIYTFCDDVNITITILDIIHRPVFILRHDVSETGLCLHL